MTPLVARFIKDESGTTAIGVGISVAVLASGHHDGKRALTL